MEVIGLMGSIGRWWTGGGGQELKDDLMEELRIRLLTDTNAVYLDLVITEYTPFYVEYY